MFVIFALGLAAFVGVIKYIGDQTFEFYIQGKKSSMFVKDSNRCNMNLVSFWFYGFGYTMLL
jgi:hypothetical protein